MNNTSPSTIIEPNFTPENGGTPTGVPVIGAGATDRAVLVFGGVRVPFRSSTLDAAKKKMMLARRTLFTVNNGGTDFEKRKAMEAFDRAEIAVKRAETKMLDMYGVHATPTGEYKVIASRYPRLLDVWNTRMALTTAGGDLAAAA